MHEHGFESLKVSCLRSYPWNSCMNYSLHEVLCVVISAQAGLCCLTLCLRQHTVSACFMYSLNNMFITGNAWHFVKNIEAQITSWADQLEVSIFLLYQSYLKNRSVSFGEYKKVFVWKHYFTTSRTIVCTCFICKVILLYNF